MGCLACTSGRGKGKRRFAPQGVWRSGGTGPDVEPVVWLPGAPKSFPRPPLPSPSMDTGSGKKPRKKDEFYLAEVQLMSGNSARQRSSVLALTLVHMYVLKSIPEHDFNPSKRIPCSWQGSSGGPTSLPTRGSSTVLLWTESTRHLGTPSECQCSDLSWRFSSRETTPPPPPLLPPPPPPPPVLHTVLLWGWSIAST